MSPETPACDSTCPACALPIASGKPTQRVLLVDDEENILMALRRLLRREPYTLLTARSGDEALEIMRQEPVQLVVTDHRMPGMTGTALLREVQRCWPDTVRVVLSGYSEVASIIAAVNDGAIYKFLTKPWNDDELKLNVRRALERHALVAENQRLTSEVVAQNEQLRRLNALLDQRASDATQGLTCSQTLLETIDAGVLVIDSDGLCVIANARAKELLGGPLVSQSASVAVPPPLYGALCSNGRWQTGESHGSFQQDDAVVLWRSRPFGCCDDAQAIAITLWVLAT